jgi:probable F420-dependent oxidoreductase
LLFSGTTYLPETLTSQLTTGNQASVHEETPKFGAVFPAMEMGATPPEVIRAFAVGVEVAGYQHIALFDHVVAADSARHQGWRGPYTLAHPFREPLTLMAFLAGVCSLELFTGVLVLPQRQTALVAKQAAEIDLLTNGRLRLGVGIGWNELEYRALGGDFERRGVRVEEQIAALRALWTHRSVDTLQVGSETFEGVGISPLPIQRPIPIWLGTGTSPRVLDRISRLADGWMPLITPGPELFRAYKAIRDGAARLGRNRHEIGLQGTVFTRAGMSRMVHHVSKWIEAGATHITVSTVGAGLSPDDHVTVLGEAYARILDSGCLRW